MGNILEQCATQSMQVKVRWEVEEGREFDKQETVTYTHGQYGAQKLSAWFMDMSTPSIVSCL